MPVKIITDSNSEQLEESINEFLEEQTKNTPGFKPEFHYSVSSYGYDRGTKGSDVSGTTFSVLISW